MTDGYVDIEASYEDGKRRTNHKATIASQALTGRRPQQAGGDMVTAALSIDRLTQQRASHACPLSDLTGGSRASTHGPLLPGLDASQAAERRTSRGR